MCVGASTRGLCRRFCSKCGLYGTSRAGAVNAFPPSHSFTVQWRRRVATARARRERHPVARSFAFKVAGTNGTAFVGRLRCPPVCISVNSILCTTPASSTSRPTTPETELPEWRRGRINSYICLRCPGRRRHCRSDGVPNPNAQRVSETRLSRAPRHRK